MCVVVPCSTRLLLDTPQLDFVLGCFGCPSIVVAVAVVLAVVVVVVVVITNLKPSILAARTPLVWASETAFIIYQVVARHCLQLSR